MDIKILITDIFNRNIESIINFIPSLLLATISFIVILNLGKIFNKIIVKLVKTSKFYKLHGNLVIRTSKIFYAFFAVIIFLDIIGFENLSTSIFASGGVVTIILGFALREIGENFCAGLLLSINKPFKIGDTIKSLDVEGSVKSIEIRHTHIRSADGKDIYVPSSQIYKNTLINYTKDGLRRFDFTVGIDYTSNLKRACEIIDKELVTVPGILNDPKSGCVVNKLLPGYIEIIVYFWINIEGDFSIKQVKEDSISKIKDRLLDEEFILSDKSLSSLQVSIQNNDQKIENVN